MKKAKLFVLGIATFGMLLTGCSNVAPEIQEYEPYNTEEGLSDEEEIEVLSDWNPIISFTQDPDLKPVFDEMDPVPIEEQQRMSSTLFDFKKGDSLRIRLMEDTGPHNANSHTYSSKYHSIIEKQANYDNYIAVNDINGQDQDVILTTDGSCIYLPINSSFDYGEVYTIELTKKDTLYFDGKDQSIQSITVEIEDDPNETPRENAIDLKDDIVTLDLSKVSEEHVNESATYSFTYSGDAPSMKEGDIFVVKNNQNAEKLEITDFYGKFLSKEDLGDGKYKVIYKEPQGNEVYDDLYMKGEEPFDPEGHITPLDESSDEVLNSIRYSTFTRGYLNFCAKTLNTNDEEVLGDVLDKLKVDISYNFYDGKLTFSINIHVDDLKLADGIYFSFGVKYTQIVSFKVDFDIGIKTKWFIPVGIKYKLKMIQVKQESIEFDFVVYSKAEDKPGDEEELKSTLVDEMKKAKGGEGSFYDKLKNSAEAVAQTEGNKTTIPLFKVDCPIYPPVVFDFRIDFIIDLSVQAMLVIKKQWESETTIFNFSNQGGGDADTGQSVTKATSWDVYFMGQIELTLTLRFSGNLYIEGTYKFCHLSLYFDLYVKIGIQGVITAVFPTGTDGSDFVDANVSLDLYVLMGGRVGIEIVIAILSENISKDIFKTYILRFVFTNELLEHIKQEGVGDEYDGVIEMKKSIMSIDETDVLNFRSWNGVTMRMEENKYLASSVTKIIESWFGDLEIRMFEFKDYDTNLMEITEDGVIKVKDGTAAEFYTTFKVGISNVAGFLDDLVIQLHFNDAAAKHIYIENVDMGRYREGVKYTLPEPPTKDGHKFLNYEIGEQILQPGDEITMGTEDIYVEIEWHKIIYYTVIFYDGLNNLIYIDTHVEEMTAVTPPSPEIRDQFMSGYFFIGWDKKIDYITCDLVVHGLYMKVGD